MPQPGYVLCINSAYLPILGLFGAKYQADQEGSALTSASWDMKELKGGAHLADAKSFRLL